MPVSASDDDEDEDDDDDDDDDDDVGAGASARRCVWETPLTLSKQCIMMAYERALDLTAGSVATKLETTEMVRFGNKETDEIDPDIFVIPVPIHQHESGIVMGLPPDYDDGEGLVPALRRSLFSSGKDVQFQRRIRSLDLLCKLHEVRTQSFREASDAAAKRHASPPAPSPNACA
uniref:Uncharacterized protein n=2 Tax=Phaeomonas parva TaxID=124430 RepID=A0A6U4JM24_9STRA|mmetsp:Transcript_39839/g.124517  ORF Transcript_39839/g.124517 Transcript_39839/m.124517 type:complete len:175 (+) Transcript_39839:1-525(+)